MSTRERNSFSLLHVLLSVRVTMKECRYHFPSLSYIVAHGIFFNSSNCIFDFSLPDIIKISRFPFSVFFSNRITVKLGPFGDTSKQTYKFP